MSRKRKNNAVEGGDDSSRNSKGNNDSNKKKSKKQQVDHVVKTGKNVKNSSSAAAEKGPSLVGGGEGGGGGGGGDSPWSKSKKKRMRNLKIKLLKKQQDPEPSGGADNTVKAKTVASKNSSKKETSGTASSSSPKQQQATDKISEKQTNNNTNNANADPSLSLQPRFSTATSTLQQAFMARLSGSRFRILNEELYTTTSSTAFERFSAHPELYDEYHNGFRSQVEHWPVNPVDVIVGRLKKDHVDAFFDDNKNSEPANTNTSKKDEKQNRIINKQQIVVADFGCGDADLAKQLLKVQIPLQQQQQQQQGGGKRQKGGSRSDDKSNSYWCPFLVHSFDLVSQSDLVTACDMSNVPLPNGTVDVAVFCLSLMGTNLADFVREAHRVLKSSGRLKIAEVKSRFSSSSTSSTNKNTNNNQKTSKNSRGSKKKNNNNEGQDEEREFIQVLKQLGFECTRTDRSNKMFVLFELIKNGKMPDPKVEYTAKPCIYKRR